MNRNLKLVASEGLVVISLSGGPVVVDRIVAVVNMHAIKMSDIERDLRVTQFLNHESLSMTTATKKVALQRLIDQELIRSELAGAGNSGHLNAEAKQVSDRLLQERFEGSKEQLAAALRKYGLTEKQLLEQLQWQLVVLRFIDERFRPGVLVPDEDVRGYYEQHASELKQQMPGGSSFETLTPEIRKTLEAERIDRNFEQWLGQTRKNTRIEIKVEELK